MARNFFVSAAFCVGGVALMLLPLAVPVSFGNGLAGRPSLFPEWLVAVFFYTLMTLFVALTARMALIDLRRSQGPKMRVQRPDVLVRLHERAELATVPTDTRGIVRVVLREVKGGERARFVGRVWIRGNPSRTLGELIHDEGTPVAEFEAQLPGRHDGVLEWVTTEFEAQKPAVTQVRASIEVQLLVPQRRSRRDVSAPSPPR